MRSALLFLALIIHRCAAIGDDTGEFRITREALDREIRKCGTKPEQKIGKCLEVSSPSPPSTHSPSAHPELRQLPSRERRINTSATLQSPGRQRLQGALPPVRGLQGGRAFSTHSTPQDCTRSVKCDSLSLRAVDASYEYMCGRGYALFEKHAECFAEVGPFTTSRQLPRSRVSRSTSGASTRPVGRWTPPSNGTSGRRRRVAPT